MTVLICVLTNCREAEVPAHLRVAGGDPARGRTVVAQTGCGVCHVIPSVRGASGRVGPSLEAFGSRSLIAGRLPNRPDYLVRFVSDAPALVPDTAMPKLPLDDRDSRDVASFLYTLQ